MEAKLKKIYIGNLPISATEDDVSVLFGQHGSVSSVILMRDKETGHSRGFGFVEMPLDDANVAIDVLDGIEFQDRKLRVNEARDRGAPAPRRSF